MNGSGHNHGHVAYSHGRTSVCLSCHLYTMGNAQYADRKSAARSYRPSGYMSRGLLRAREPYRVKNAMTGLAISSFAVGVWLYSMRAVKQDNFDDVDEEARAMVMSGVKAVGDKSLGAEERTAARARG